MDTRLRTAYFTALVAVSVSMVSGKDVVSGVPEGCPPGKRLCFGGDLSQVTCYNPSTERCCDGIPIARRYGESCAGRDMKFCGAKKYNSTSGEWDCCGGEAHGEVYNTKQSTCCSDGISSVIHEVKEGFHCCGTDYINSATYKCCTTTYDHKKPKPYNFQHYMCCATQHDTKISDYMPTVDIDLKTCCGLDTMYKGDPDKMCCNDKIVKQRAGQGCCADRGLFDNSTHMCCQGEKTVKRNECCQGQVHSPEEGRTACCAGTAYNPDTHSCCQDTVVNGTGQCCGKAVMDPNLDSCCQDTIEQNASVPQTSPYHGCCGSHAMNNQTHTCCTSTAVPKGVGKACCGKRTYDQESELCCGPEHDVVQTKATNNTRCCGSETYESGEENCCVGRTAALKIPAGRECCRTEGGEYRDYDPRNATCCGGQVHDGIPKDKKMCCGDTMRSDQQLCCQDNNRNYQLLTKSGQENKCCLDHDTNDILLYDSEDKVCHHGKLSYKVPGQECGSTYFDPREKICCSGVLHSKGDEADRRCCGRGPRAYSPSYQSCCHGRIKTDPEQIWGCCRGKFYHKNEHDCSGPHQRLVSYVGETPTRPPPDTQTSPAGQTITCAGRKYGRWSEDGRERRCCDEKRNDKTYFPHNQTCCGSRVYDLPEETAGCCQGVAYDNTTQCCIQQKVQNCTDQPTPDTPSDTKEQFFCSGYKHDKYDEQGNERLCCPRSHKSYTPATQICCGSRVANIPSSKAGCCRGTPYSKDRYSCSRRKLTPLPLPTSPPPETVETTSPGHPEDNGKSTIPSSTSLTTTTTVNPSTPTPSNATHTKEHISCRGYKHDKYDEQGNERLCCGRSDKSYTPATQKCCGSRVADIPSSKAGCCRGTPYSKDRYSCSRRKLTPLPLPTSPPPETVETTSPGHPEDNDKSTISSTDQPTPSNPTHTKEQISCSGYKHDKYDEQGNERLCCPRSYSRRSYTPATQKCCGSRVADIPSSKAGCCRGTPYSKDRYSCSRRKLTPLPLPTSPPPETVETTSPGHPEDNDKSTIPSTTTLTTTTTTVDPSTPTPPWKPNYPECGGKEYNPTTYICYKNKTFFKDKYDVCNGNLIITTKEKCCDGRIRKLKKRKTECCGKWLVNPRRVDCTDNKPVKRTVTCEEKCDTKFKRRLDWKFPECTKAHIFSAKVQEELEVPLMNTNMTTFILTDIDDATSKRQISKNNKPLQNYLFMQVHRCQCPTFRVGRRYLFLTDANIASGAFMYDPLKDVVIRYKLDRMFLIKKLHKRGKCYGEVYYPTI